MSREALRAWLIDAVAAEARLDPARLDPSASFHDLGLTSAQAVTLAGELQDRMGEPLPPTLLYEHATIEALAEALGAAPTEPAAAAATTADDDQICIVGLACRFPGGDTPDRFFASLLDGTDATADVPPDRWDASAYYDPDRTAKGKAYTTRGAFVDDFAGFDAGAFGIPPGEAIRMDPQHRQLLEVSWTALEDAGINARGTRTGVFVGLMGSQEYGRLQADHEGDSCLDDPYLAYGTAPSVAAGRLSYALDLHGPSLSVDTACSSSLLAVHLAAASLRRGECDLALAGGASALLHPAAMVQACAAHMLAADGRCKTFDEAADGFVMGEGCGVVVLERLSDAQRRGARVLAVVRGSASNQDGRSNGMTAPSQPAQVAVVRDALARAGVAAAEVDFVEAHGSGTRLGDAIELSALQEVFGAERERPLVVGAVKTAVGHLLGAAGIAGLIKTVQAIRHGRIPPNRNLAARSTAIDWDRAPVVLPHEPVAWSSERRVAGVSSFGWSGTNVHVVVEAPPAPPAREPGDADWVVLPLSAHTTTALERVTGELADHVAGTDLADVAYTLQVGRGELAQRAAVVCRDVGEAADALRAAEPSRADTRTRTVFVFPGTGDHHPGMGAELYTAEPPFRAAFDACAEAALPLLAFDLRSEFEQAAPDLATLLGRGECAAPRRIDIAHCATFALEYSLAALLRAWGVEPSAMLGYSLGEYVAATVAGVFALEDAMLAVARRAQLFAGLPAGAMLATAATAAELEALLPAGLSIAATNGPAMTVASGPVGGVEELERRLDRHGVAHRRVNTSRALHSPELDPVAEPVTELIGGLRRNAPAIPFVSSVTGSWITAEAAVDPAYWALQMRAPVRFDAGLATLTEGGFAVVLEVGPGMALTSVARQLVPDADAVAALPSAVVGGSEREFVLRALARHWSRGGHVDWKQLHRPGARRLADLPTYPFEHQRFWPQGAATAKLPRTTQDLADWGYAPRWREAPLTAPPADGAAAAPWLVFCDGSELSVAITAELHERAERVVVARPGHAFAALGPSAYMLDPASADDHERLFAELERLQQFPARILHAWSLTGEAGEALDRGFFSLLATVRAGGRRAAGRELRIMALSSGIHDVLGTERTEPRKAALLGLTRTTEPEFPTLRFRSVEVAPAADTRQLTAEILTDAPEPAVAYRGTRRWAQSWEPVRLEAAHPWRPEGAYLITGGLGGLGLALAKQLATRGPARLALVGRTPLPPRERWSDPQLEASDRRRIEAVVELERLGADVLALAADVATRGEIAGAVAQAVAHFGALHGVVHAAGVPAGGLIQLKTRAEAEAVLRPKVEGTLALAEALAGQPLDFLALYSSAVVAHGGLGESDYAAANCFLDAYARQARRDGAPVTAIDWGPWRWDAWTQDGPDSPLRELRRTHGITDEQGVELLSRILAGDHAQILVAQQEPEILAARWAELTRDLVAPAAPRQTFARPALRTAYVPPRSELEHTIAGIWRRYLGLDRVGMDDQFFELGGTSLIGLTIVGELSRELGTPVTAADLFAAPTPGALATQLGTDGNGATERQAGARGTKRQQLAAATAGRRRNSKRGAR